MVVVLPTRSVFHILCNATAPNAFQITGSPHHQYPELLPQQSAGNALSNRYQPYPQLDVLPLGQHLIFGKQRRANRHGSRSEDRGPGNSMVQPLAQAPPQSGCGMRAMMAVNSNPSLSTVLDCDVEMDEVACVPEMDLLDVEMEDDFLPQIPAIIASTTISHGRSMA